MPLHLNEIKLKATQFVLDWKDKVGTAREEADAQTFQTEFLAIFGVTRNKVAVFEQKVKLAQGSAGYIDLLWKGYILIEMKSPGKNLEHAYEQAKEYALALPEADTPRVILISDFVTFEYYDLEKNAEKTSFPLTELEEHIELFVFLAGYKDVEYKKADAVNIEAAEKMGGLHDALKSAGYAGHALEVYLVRLLFCLFADDTGIFEHDHFIKYILQHTDIDGSDLAMHIQKIFEVLNTPRHSRLKTLSKELNTFPYVNGGLFAETLPIADFDHSMREALLACAQLDWSVISPSIFGAMFQSVMTPEERHSLGAHYTSEENILKVLHPLFLDELWKRFDNACKQGTKAKVASLNRLHDEIATLKFLDPACGCGNFLVVAYRELRLLELAIIEELKASSKDEQQVLDVAELIKVNVSQFYGIELEEFPSQIAQTAMWLTDHQMNRLVAKRFGQYFVRIPLTASAKIICGNALKIDWREIVPPSELNYILGNPPFLGSRKMNATQKAELKAIFPKTKHTGDLDYVTCWYKKAVDYIKEVPAEMATVAPIECAFVSTNSICQGLQVPIIWKKLFDEGVHINFAHQTFKWWNEAKGKAAVYCIIVGFALKERSEKLLYVYDDIKAEPKETKAGHINAYLMNANDVFIERMQEAICDVPKMCFGNMPADGGALIIEENELEGFLEKEPKAKKYIKKFLGAEEFINNKNRYCLWLVGADPKEIRTMPLVMERVERCKKTREYSARPHLANTPSLFAQITQPEGVPYLLVPAVSSEQRKYIPIGFLDSSVIASNATLIVPNASLYHFAILTSAMHMAWMRAVAGRLKSDYRYSKDVVYNNFPWPIATQEQQEKIEEKGQAVLDARSLYPDASLADLYDPLTMPLELAKAHASLDLAVDRLYSKTKFANDAMRVAHLFALYEKLTLRK